MDWTLLGFILYLIVILYVGFRTYRINKSYKDYFIAGRKLNPWVVAFSERASSESSWLILGLPGAAFALGFVEIWSALGCTLGVIASWTFVAKPLRIETEKYDAITLPDYYAEKFGNDTAIRLIAAIIIVFFFLFYLAAQFNGAGKVFNVTFGIPHVWGMILGAVIIVFYTMLGGFFAVAWTDLIQGIIMIGALVILPLVGLIELAQHGTNLADAVSSSGSNFTSLTGGKIGWAAVAAVIAGLSWGLGYMGQPHLVTRFMSIRSADEIKISRRIAIVWAIPAFAGAILIGLCFLALKNNGFFEGIDLSDPEIVMPLFTKTILPAWLAGIFISGAVAAMMSTADSQLLVISSSLIQDIYHKVMKSKVSDEKLLYLSRIITVLVGIIGFIIALTSTKLIYQLVSYAWSGLGSSFAPTLLLILYWKKTTSQGVIAGMLTGFITTIIWTEIAALNSFITVRFVSFILALIVTWIVSLFTYNKGKVAA